VTPDELRRHLHHEHDVTKHDLDSMSDLICESEHEMAHASGSRTHHHRDESKEGTP
jgi:hypothetical protein